jgi:hypothetical protein
LAYTAVKKEVEQHALGLGSNVLDERFLPAWSKQSYQPPAAILPGSAQPLFLSFARLCLDISPPFQALSHYEIDDPIFSKKPRTCREGDTTSA